VKDILFILGLVVAIAGVQAEAVYYNLGNHNVSFELNNVSEYNSAIEPPMYRPNDKSWTYTLNMTNLNGGDLHINLHEYPKSQDIDLSEERKMVALGFDMIGIGGYGFADVIIGGHSGYTLHFPEQRILAYTKNEQVMPEEYGASYWQDDKTSINIGTSGLNKEVFDLLVNSIQVN
jgi:hypothetical protein